MEEKKAQDDNDLISGVPDVGVGQNLTWVKKIVEAFPALKERNYRLYFFGQLISLSGTWLQIVAQSWLVLKLTNSAFYMGLVAAFGTVPTLLFTLIGGVIVDRFSKRRILLFTQVSSMVLAFLLGVLTVLNIVTVWQISIIAFLLGTINAIDAPARQSYMSEIVSKEDLSSAIGLNSGVFNAARVLGPGVAGILIAIVGIGGAFLMNGVSYIAVIIALIAMRVSPASPGISVHPLTAVKQGLQYSFRHPIISTLVIYAGVTSVFGWSYTTVLPLIARNDFHLGAEGLGYLYAASGMGSFAAAITVAAFSKKISPLVFLLGGSLMFCSGIFLFTFTKDLIWALPLLVIAGFGILAQAATINTTIQSLVKSEFRGRVMSIYILMFIGLTPLGNLQIGFISEHLGTAFAIRLGAIIIIVFASGLYLFKDKIRANFELYKKSNS